MVRNTFLVFGALFISGCAFFAASPHDNFIAHLNSQIGKNIDEVPYYQIPHREDMINSKNLPNGNIENEYKYRGTCRYFYEINPVTHKIVGARFEGNDKDCSINP